MNAEEELAVAIANAQKSPMAEKTHFMCARILSPPGLSGFPEASRLAVRGVPLPRYLFN
jgi:hypothetical protein